MTAQAAVPALADQSLRPYLDAEGALPTSLQRQIGVYAIFDQAQTLRYVGYSRDIYQSLKQHLVRQSDACWGYKLHTIERPSRTLLESIKQAWTQEGSLTLNAEDEAAWGDAIDAKTTITEAEWTEYNKLGEVEQTKYLKKVARRLEAQILETLKARGVTMELRFNPKLKEDGLLDLK